MTRRVPDARALSPPEDEVLLVALACERPRREGAPAPAAAPPPEAAGTPPPSAPTRPRPRYVPLARFSVTDVCERATGLGLDMSYSTVWRRLHAHALRPWFQEQWLFPTDPRLLEKAAPVLDLYHGLWQGAPLRATDAVLSADEITTLQALSRTHPGAPPAPGRRARYEFEYERHGTLCYAAFLEVRTGQVFGKTSATSSIESFQTALAHCLARPRATRWERIFLILDNGPSHHPRTSPARLAALDPRIIAVHLPTHSSWLNQVELYFSILVRKALTPRDFPSLAALRDQIHRFEGYYNEVAAPFRWQFSRNDLERYVERLGRHEARYAETAAALAARREQVGSEAIH